MNSAEEHCHELGTQGDMLKFYDCYLKKLNANSGKESILLNTLALNSDETASLMVIDMQNDFIKPAPGLEVIPPGRFSVANGKSIIDIFETFIIPNQNKFNKIIFTRDTHTIDHCSFFTVGKPPEIPLGPFPPHCVANELGAAFNPEIKRIGESLGEKAEVVFKGCYQHADSFGAHEYTNEDLKKRQLGSCCSSNNCSIINTGSFYLKQKEGESNDDYKKRQWSDFPFSFDNYSLPDDVLTQKICPKSTEENIIKDLDIINKFNIKKLLPEGYDNTKTHYIFVMGLAGDYCVKDTALNLMKDPTRPTNVKVVVIQPLTRYGFLPLQFIGSEQVYKGVKLANTGANNFTKITSTGEKDINHYLFQGLGENNFKIVTKEDITKNDTIIKNIKNIKHPWTPKPNASANASANTTPKFYGPEADKFEISNPKYYFAFLTPIKEIINDYNAAGVKIVMTNPILDKVTQLAGGRRRRNSKKATRKQMKRKRQTYRRRR